MYQPTNNSGMQYGNGNNPFCAPEFSAQNFNQQPIPPFQQGYYTQPRSQPPAQMNPSGPPNTKKLKPKRKRGGCLWALLKFVLVIALIVAVIFAGIKVKDYFELRKLREEFKQTIPAWDISSEISQQIEDLSQVPSDIDGMSVKDKLDAGYLPGDGSDTDGDGLTDKEELEIYGTDPLKASTAEDGVPDGLKVQNGLNPTDKISPETVQGSYSQLYPEVVFNDVPAAASVVMEEVQGYKFNGAPALKVYSVSNYVGTLSVDFSSVLPDSDYVIFMRKDSIGSEYEQLSDKSGIVTVKSDGVGFVIGCAATTDLEFNSDFNAEQTFTSGSSWMVLYPITGLNGPMEVHFVESDSFGLKKDRSEEMLQYILAGSPDLEGEIEVYHDILDPVSFAVASAVFDFFYEDKFTNMVFSQVAQTEPSADTEESRGMFRTIISLFIMVAKMEPEDWSSFAAKPVVPEEDPVVEVATRPSEYVTSFDVTKDALPFANFRSFVSTGGNCAGFAQITSEVFIGDYPLASDLIVDSEDGIEYPYDISGIPECETFFNKGLSDYKSYSYWKDTYPDGMVDRNVVSENDQRFLEFLGAKWAYWNDFEKNIRYYNSEASWSSLESVFEYIKANDEVLILGMSTGGSGHAVNLYGFEPDPDDPNVWYALVYDNNFPNNMWGDRPIDNRIKLIKKTPMFGEPYFEFDYFPLPDVAPDYRYTSLLTKNFSSGTGALITALQAHMFVITNTERTVLLQ